MKLYMWVSEADKTRDLKGEMANSGEEGPSQDQNSTIRQPKGIVSFVGNEREIQRKLSTQQIWLLNQSCA